jgi:hypothetical protein
MFTLDHCDTLDRLSECFKQISASQVALSATRSEMCKIERRELLLRQLLRAGGRFMENEVLLIATS